MAAGVRRLVNQNQTAPRAEDVDEGGEGGREREQDLKAARQRAASEAGGQADRLRQALRTNLQPALATTHSHHQTNSNSHLTQSTTPPKSTNPPLANLTHKHWPCCARLAAASPHCRYLSSLPLCFSSCCCAAQILVTPTHN